MGVPCFVLKGAKDGGVKDYLTNLEEFGKGKHRSVKYWKALGQSLVAEKLLSQNQRRFGGGGRGGRGGFGRNGGGSFTAYAISPEGEEFLANASAVLKIYPTNELRQERRNVATTRPPTAGASAQLLNVVPTTSFSKEDPATQKLVRLLMELRSEIAQETNLAPYMIFSEEFLQKMAVSELGEKYGCHHEYFYHLRYF